MPASDIIIKGAREHNLRDVDLVLPRNKLICLTGVSGSGKSSLAFDTLYAEGQRRYVESLSTFARQFLGQMPKPDVDHISGLSPSISIAQKSAGSNPRSTVGTITEIYDFLRVLFARVGQGRCHQCQQPITAQTREQIIARILALPAKTKFAVLAPLVRQQKGEFRDLCEDLLKQGFVRARVDGQVVQLTDDLGLDRQMRHDIEVVVDRLTNGASIRTRLAEAVELALKVGEGNIIVATESDDADTTAKKTTKKKRRGAPLAGDLVLSADYACNACGISFQPPSPQLFSFNSPQGMCFECDGLGQMFSFDPEKLVTDPEKSLAKGCIELLGQWKDLGRWKRHIYKGVAETMERKLELKSGSLAETPWQELTEEQQFLWLWGTGEEHITYTWRGGKNSQKYGGTFDGIIPELLEKYRNAKSKSLIAKLEKFMNVIRCPDCEGQRLSPQARSTTVTTAHPNFADKAELTLPQICGLPIDEAEAFFSELKLNETSATIAAEVLKEIRGRLGFLINVGLDYLSLDRTAPTLSGGETQRIRLAGQIGCGLVGVLYILDEPSIGLHPRDNDRLLGTLERLRDQGNTVVVVEHDEDTMRAADHIIDFGPGPGIRGGDVVAEGTAVEVGRKKKSVTGAYLAGNREIEVPTQRRINNTGATPSAVESKLKIIGARHNNLKNIDVEIPLGAFVCVTGASGSGKSSLVSDILVEALRRDLNNGKGMPGEHDGIEGLEHLDKMIAIDQSPIGRTPRSNPATYIKVFDDIRSLYAQLPESKRRGFRPGRFSFNVAGGRCEACSGNGANKLEMDFLADVWIPCSVCGGHRFNHESLQVKYKGKSIADVLEMDIQQALEHFENVPNIRHKLETLHAVGLDYMKLGQPSPTLSGGEAQRIKLARELVKKSTGRTLYMLDEPTTGLHFADIEMLLEVLHAFVDAGNTVLVVEHNLDVIKTADWIIDVGPEGGKAGGQIVAAGTPEQIVEQTRNAKGGRRKTNNQESPLPPSQFSSHTATALAPYLGIEVKNGQTKKKSLRRQTVKQASHIVLEGARQHNLRDVSAKIPRDKLTVCCGPSGSGKSSLAMDTIYAEGQRRYVESLSSYARQFVGQLQKPQVESIEGLSPAIAIEQRTTGHSPRSTVGTVTEIYDYFRILLSRLGQMHCPECDAEIGTQSSDEVIEAVLAEPEGTKLYLMAPVELGAGQTYEDLWKTLGDAGYVRVRVDGQTHELADMPSIDRRRKHDVEVIVDRVSIRQASRGRLADSIENTLTLGRGVLHTVIVEPDVPEARWVHKVHSQHLVCTSCNRSFEPLSPHHFSFNSALGWCEACEGLGVETGADPAALLRSTHLTLAEGAILAWPGVDQPLFAAMLQALSSQMGLPIDVSYDQLSPRQRRLVLYGTGDDWIEVKPTGASASAVGNGNLKFQYKGLYPALEEASRISPRLRSRLEEFVGEIECSECGGSRLRDDASAVRFAGRTIDQYCRLPLGQLLEVVKKWKLPAAQKKIAGELVREISNRLTFLIEVGLEYLTIGRSAPTLSGGESQRIRLASQVGSGLCGVLYVLDEPTIGLHPRDNTRLVAALHKLRDLGNTLMVVEHDREVIDGADEILDFGPAAGRKGGEIVARGTPAEVAKRRKSVTGPYIAGKKAISIPKNRRIEDGATASSVGTKPPGPLLSIRGARQHNLKNIDVHFPLGNLIGVTGVSGSGKSSLVEDILYNQLARTLHRAGTSPGAHDRIVGIEHIDKVIRVDQRSLGNSPSSNPATYTGLFELIRQLFAQLPDSKLRGYAARRFSFNVPGGRCDACDGAGQLCIEMHFLPDVWVDCDTCHGHRFNQETLEVKYRGRSIADVLEMSCGEALALFSNIPKIRRILQTLCDVGLDYVALGQSAATLSGGEAQRVKLASELSRPDTGKTLYLLDEPTTGLHFDDIAKLLKVLNSLVEQGNTVVVIEHNLDVIKTADWIVDIGPDAGSSGGWIVAQGTPEDIVAHSEIANRLPASKSTRTKKSTEVVLPSHTGTILGPVLKSADRREREVYDAVAARTKKKDDVDLREIGRSAKMPWQTDGRTWHTSDRISHNGKPCRWQGAALEHLVSPLEEDNRFAAINWNNRTIVEVTNAQKQGGWFLHAMTGQEWLLTFKLRVKKGTFSQDDLRERLDLKPLDDIEELPVYGKSQRVKVKNLKGPWQEVTLSVHWLKELETPEFAEFYRQAQQAYLQRIETRPVDKESLMPWKVLKRKWHVSRKGFPSGKRVAWSADVLDQLLTQIENTVTNVEIVWDNKAVINFVSATDKKQLVATVHTKRREGIDLTLLTQPGQISLGRIAEFGTEREVGLYRDGREAVKIRFTKLKEVKHAKLKTVLANFNKKL